MEPSVHSVFKMVELPTLCFENIYYIMKIFSELVEFQYLVLKCPKRKTILDFVATGYLDDFHGGKICN